MLIQHKLLTAAVVEPLLRGRFGRPYLWSESCPSTQDVLRGTDLPEGAVALTEHQTSGRGREGRTWEDVAGTSLLLSLLLRPPAVLPAQQLSLVVGLAVADAVEERRGAAEIKWPNDVLVGGRKVAGVLLEAIEGTVVCGIGVNVSQDESELPTGSPVRAGSLWASRVGATARPLRRCSDPGPATTPGAARGSRRYDELEARNVLRGSTWRSAAGWRGRADRSDGELTVARETGGSYGRAARRTHTNRLRRPEARHCRPRHAGEDDVPGDEGIPM